MAHRSKAWTVGLESWVIQDGNYPDFVAGQRAEFALELYAADGLRRTDPVDQPGCRLVADSTYEVCAEVVHADRDAVVPSFGLLAYSIRMIDVPADAYALAIGSRARSTWRSTRSSISSSWREAQAIAASDLRLASG